MPKPGNTLHRREFQASAEKYGEHNHGERK